METAHEVCSLGGHLLRVWDWDWGGGEDVLSGRFFRSEALARRLRAHSPPGRCQQIQRIWVSESGLVEEHIGDF